MLQHLFHHLLKHLNQVHCKIPLRLQCLRLQSRCRLFFSEIHVHLQLFQALPIVSLQRGWKKIDTFSAVGEEHDIKASSGNSASKSAEPVPAVITNYLNILWFYLKRLEAFLGFDFIDLCFGCILTELLGAAKEAASDAQAHQADALSSVEPWLVEIGFQESSNLLIWRYIKHYKAI